MRVGLPQHPPGLDSAPRQQAGKHITPMMATIGEQFAAGVFAPCGDRRNARRSAHLAAHHHEGLLQQAPLLQIVEDSRETVIERGEQLSLQVAKRVLVRVPAPQVDLNQPDSRFHQPPGDQEALPPLFPSIPVPHMVGLLGQVEGVRLARPGGDQQL